MKKYGPRMVENRVFRRIFGINRDEMIGGWRKYKIKSLRNFIPRQI
jgi:hypothetical protein